MPFGRKDWFGLGPPDALVSFHYRKFDENARLPFLVLLNH